jgi:hypothetical protein
LLGYTPWFFLNKTLDRTFCTSQLAEPFIREGDRNRRAPRRGDGRLTRRLTVPSLHLRSFPFRRVV